MITPQLSLQDITRIELGPISKFDANEECPFNFFSRNITFYTGEQEVAVVSLIANEKENIIPITTPD